MTYLVLLCKCYSWYMDFSVLLREAPSVKPSWFLFWLALRGSLERLVIHSSTTLPGSDDTVILLNFLGSVANLSLFGTGVMTPTLNTLGIWLVLKHFLVISVMIGRSCSISACLRCSDVIPEISGALLFFSRISFRTWVWFTDGDGASGNVEIISHCSHVDLMSQTACFDDVICAQVCVTSRRDSGSQIHGNNLKCKELFLTLFAVRDFQRTPLGPSSK